MYGNGADPFVSEKATALLELKCCAPSKKFTNRGSYRILRLEEEIAKVRIETGGGGRGGRALAGPH